MEFKKLKQQEPQLMFQTNEVKVIGRDGNVVARTLYKTKSPNRAYITAH
jgi:hypothetical protein